MIHELIYTSVERGLKPGSYGFCTVATTPNLPPALADRLELMSGYRHVFGPESGKSALNPVAYSHLTLTLGKDTYHVLSRIADSGVDYSKRSNKIAHHIAFSASQFARAGPAAVLAERGLMQTDWQGKPRHLPVRSELPAPETRCGRCATWETLSGDAGWGGVLAESARSRAGQFAVIYPSGTDVLQLLRESLELLPPHEQWQVTFSTYFMKLAPGTTCQWRCVLDGTNEADITRRQGGRRLIDLTRRVGRASGGELVEAARTGAVRHAAGEATRPLSADDAMPTVGRFSLSPVLNEQVPVANTPLRPLRDAQLRSAEREPPSKDFHSSKPPQLPRQRSRGPSMVHLATAAVGAAALVTVAAFFLSAHTAGPAATRHATQPELHPQLPKPRPTNHETDRESPAGRTGDDQTDLYDSNDDAPPPQKLEFRGIDKQTIRVGERMELAITVLGAPYRQGELTFEIIGAPVGLPVDAIHTDTLIWQPTVDDIGRHRIVLLGKTSSRVGEVEIDIEVVAADGPRSRSVVNSELPLSPTRSGDDSPSDSSSMGRKQRPIVLDLSGDKHFYEIDDAELSDTIDDQSLALEILDLKSFPARTEIVGRSRRSQFGNSLTIKLPVADATIRVKLSRNKAGVLGVDIKTKADIANSTLSLSRPALLETRTRLDESIIKQNSIREQHRNLLRGLMDEWADVRTLPHSNRSQLAAKTARLRNLSQQINSLQRSMRSNDRKLRFLERRWESIPDLEKLTNELHENATLHFRIISTGDRGGGEKVLFESADHTLHRVPTKCL